MPRGFDAAQRAALAEKVVSVAHFVALTLASGTVRAWDGAGSVTALGAVWTGVGEYGIIRAGQNERGHARRGASFTLHGVPATNYAGGVIARTRAEAYQRRPLAIYLGLQDPQTGALIGQPVQVWAGVADTMQFELGDAVSTTLTAEHATLLISAANGARMTAENQLTRYPGTSRDVFFDFQSRIKAKPRVAVI
jgi:hypothetical protein